MQNSGELAYWNERFGGAHYHYGTAPNAFLASQAHLLRPGMSALSVADGEGRNSVWLAGQGLAVTAFDFSPPAVEKARKLAAERGVAVDHRLADIYAWDWDARAYDLVVAIFIQFSPPAERAQVFAGLRRALAPGGLLLLQGYTPRQLDYKTGGPPHAENMYTEALLREAFGGLEIAHLVEHDDEIHEGARHSGMSALVDLVARKPARG
ncbi:MAG: methyltransferase domain-containing protein [Burkholderiales bacterium]|nr:methyltransferase domain-containing protein [Burkholderiales bacterium]